MEKNFIKKYIKEIVVSIFFVVLIILLIIILSKQKEWKLKQDLLDSKLDKAIEKLEKQSGDINTLLEKIREQDLQVITFDKEGANLKQVFESLMLDVENTNLANNNTVKLLHKETELVDKEKKAYELYKAGKYAQAYKAYDEIREIDPSRIQARYYWVCSRYYSNPMDVNSFAEILEEIKYLRSQGILETNLSEIEAGIEAERKILKGE